MAAKSSWEALSTLSEVVPSARAGRAEQHQELGALSVAGEGSHSESVISADEEGRNDAAIMSIAPAEHVCEESIGQKPAASRLDWRWLNELVNLILDGVNSAAQTAALHSVAQVFKLAQNVPDSVFAGTATNIGEALGKDNGEVRDAAGRDLGVSTGRISSSSGHCKILDAIVDKFMSEECQYANRGSFTEVMGFVFKYNKQVEEVKWEHLERFVEHMYSIFSSAIWQLRAGGCWAMGAVVVLMHERANSLGEDAGAQRISMGQLNEIERQHSKRKWRPSGWGAWWWSCRARA
ncbi:hypothetical protein FGB62_38g18 [Gracilaria domingensis]|nr:hypothetical protein FGB62_38g18 [Gracilaria domingensis]